MDAAHRNYITDSERLAWVQLARTSKIGPSTHKKLIQRFGSAQAALKAIPELPQTKHLKLCSQAEVEQEFTAHENFGAQLLLSCNPAYPMSLKAIHDAPPVLSIYGQVELLHKPCLAIVGARNASLNSKHFAKMIAEDLGRNGWIIVSGLARGIDTFAHKGALATGTMAILAGGVDHIYPQDNTTLYHAIAKDGLIISEAPFAAGPQSHFFPRRNRIISGLSQGVVVVEAAKKSGSLITANNALEQGREVFAVPGSPLDPRSQGTNTLIQQGASLVQSWEDICKELSPTTKITNYNTHTTDSSTQNEDFLPTGGEKLDATCKKILENLSTTPVILDELARQCCISPEQVLWGTLELELAGKAQRLPGNQIALMYGKK
ncbi:MAG: DNA-processing protein DprA [Pseudomonadota bacterium]